MASISGGIAKEDGNLIEVSIFGFDDRQYLRIPLSVSEFLE